MFSDVYTAAGFVQKVRKPARHTVSVYKRTIQYGHNRLSDNFMCKATAAELHQVMGSDPFDRSEHPCQLKLVELTDWLEALVA